MTEAPPDPEFLIWFSEDSDGVGHRKTGSSPFGPLRFLHLASPPRSARSVQGASSYCHPAATLGAAAAGINAFLHVADLLAGAGALLADLRALAAGVLVVGRADQHEVG
jgi:hypothetical protein